MAAGRGFEYALPLYLTGSVSRGGICRAKTKQDEFEKVSDLRGSMLVRFLTFLLF